MSANNVCLFYKFGHCKYLETCRKQHVHNICENDSCEITNCEKRHPKICRYYTQYHRCKFSSFCSFSHRISDLPSHEHENVETKEKVDELEEKLKEKEEVIQLLKVKIEEIDERNRNIELELKRVFETVKTISAVIVKEATDAVVKIISKQQDDSEKRSEKLFESFNQQLSVISTMLTSVSASSGPLCSLGTATNQPSPTQHSQADHHTELAAMRRPSCSDFTFSPALSRTSSTTCNPVKNQCELCGKTFGSDRALKKHLRSDHLLSNPQVKLKPILSP